MTRPGQNAGCRILEDFACEARADPKAPAAVPSGRGRNEGMHILREIVVGGATDDSDSGAGKDPVRQQRGYNTNLASEFYVLSVLYRLGFDAYLTLGSKKAIDIVVVRAPGDTITIDVKAVAGRDDWRAGNKTGSPRERHYVVLISYDGKFPQVAELPKVWVLPHEEFLGLVKPGRSPSSPKFVSRKQVSRLEHRRDAWALLQAGPLP